MSSQDITDPITNLMASLRHVRRGYGASDAALEFRRLRGPDKVIEPTEKDWELYRAALVAVSAASESEFIYVDAEIEEPKPRRERGDFIETEDAYRARADALAAERGVPDDLDRALSIAEWRLLTEAPKPDTGIGWDRAKGYPQGGLLQ